MKKKLLIAFAIAALLIGGSPAGYRWYRLRTVPKAVWVGLREPQQVTLYSIDPEGFEDERDGAEYFRGHRILGEVSVSSAAERQRIAGEIKQGVLAFPDPAACFNPHHAVRVVDGHGSYDLVICFECGWMEVYVDGKAADGTAIRGAHEGMNSVLRAANIPVNEIAR